MSNNIDAALLVHSGKEDSINSYGTVEDCIQFSGNEELLDRKENNFSSDIPPEIASQFTLQKNRKPDCLCITQYGACQCGQNQLRLRIESWSRRKTIILGSVMILITLWIIVVASMGSSELL